MISNRLAPRSGRVLGKTLKPAISNAENDNFVLPVVNLIDDSIGPETKAEPVCIPGHRLSVRRLRLVREIRDLPTDTKSVAARFDGFDFARDRSLQ